MKYSIVLFSSIFLAIFLVRCKKEETKPYEPIIITEYLTRNIDSAKILFQGKWNWIETKRLNRNSFIYTTPQTEGSSYTSLFSNDTIYGFKNGLFTNSQKFGFKIRKEISGVIPSDSMPVIVYYDALNNIQVYIPYLISKNYFILQWQYVHSGYGEAIYKKNN